SMAAVSSAIVGVSRSSNSSRSRRRRLAHGDKRNDSSCSRPASRHKRFLQRSPSLSATACNWFMIRVRACTMRCRCHSSCRRSRFLPTRYPDLLESDLRAASAGSVARPADRSSACVHAWYESRLRPRSTTRTATRPATVRTSGRVRWPPFPPAPSGPPEHDRTSPPLPDELIAFPGTLRYRYPPKLFAETRGENLLL